jgi:hypothetical protein
MHNFGVFPNAYRFIDPTISQYSTTGCESNFTRAKHSRKLRECFADGILLLAGCENVLPGGFCFSQFARTFCQKILSLATCCSIIDIGNKSSQAVVVLLPFGNKLSQAVVVLLPFGNKLSQAVVVLLPFGNKLSHAVVVVVVVLPPLPNVSR